MRDIYAEITKSIIDQIEAGGVDDFGQLWTVEAPQNIESKAFYRGVNHLLLGLVHRRFKYKTPIFGTFNQFNKLGAKINAGAKGYKIIYYSPSIYKDKISNEDKTGRILKVNTVFNIDQTNFQLTEETKNEFLANLNADDTIEKAGAKIDFGGAEACYIPSLDLINLPEKTAFIDSGAYYSTAFHELIHWTGADSRLKRQIKNKFASSEYALEELIAELGASFLCAKHNVKGTTKHVEYVNAWLKALKNDNRFIVEASKYAQAGADYILGLRKETSAD